MKTRNVVVGSVVAASALGFLATGVVSARPYGGCEADFGGRHAKLEHHSTHAERPMRHLMRRLDLTEEQRDQIFEIKYAQRPVMREKMKELRKGRQALQEAAMAETYDSEAVRELANRQAQIQAELIVMRNATFNNVYALLTPEQRKEIAEMKQKRDAAFQAQ